MDRNHILKPAIYWIKFGRNHLKIGQNCHIFLEEDNDIFRGIFPALRTWAKVWLTSSKPASTTRHGSIFYRECEKQILKKERLFLINNDSTLKGALLVRGLDKVIGSNKEFSKVVELLGDKFAYTAGLASRKEFEDAPGDMITSTTSAPLDL